MTATACFAPAKACSVMAGTGPLDSSAISAFEDILSFRSLFDPGPIRGARARYLPWTKAACDRILASLGPPVRP